VEKMKLVLWDDHSNMDSQLSEVPRPPLICQTELSISLTGKCLNCSGKDISQSDSLDISDLKLLEKH